MQINIGDDDSANYLTLFEEKANKTEIQMKIYTPPALEKFRSPPKHFRMRAEFKIWHDKGQVFYAMYKPGEYKKAVKIDSFNIGSETICRLMPVLLYEINNDDTLKKRLFQVEFLTSTSGDCVITLIYHRKLDDTWQTTAETLEKKLDCKIIGRSRGQKVVVSTDFIFEEFTINNRQYRYQQVETGFTQPNAAVCSYMLEWAQNVSRGLGGDLLELYCGNGNFTIPMAENFERVLATEVSKTSVHSALYNIDLNQCDNIKIARMSSEEFTQAINGTREFRRLRDIALEDYNFSTVFVDPPRAGLDKGTIEMVKKLDNILYISCNPDTLEENLKSLTQSHSIEHFAFFDQFPYTDHRECGVLLCRKTANQ